MHPRDSSGLSVALARSVLRDHEARLKLHFGIEVDALTDEQAVDLYRTLFGVAHA